MATKYPDHENQDWSDNWCDADDGTQDVGKAAAGDDAVMTANSATMTLTANEACDSLYMSGFSDTFAFAAFDLDVGGDCYLEGTFTADNGGILYCGGSLQLVAGSDYDQGADLATIMDAATGSKTITTNGVELGALTINDAAGDAIFTMTDALTCGAFVLTDGDFRTGGNDFTMDGITGAGGELAFGASTVDAGANDITLDNIAATIGAGAVTAANLDIGAGGSLTSTGDWTLAGDMLVDGGAYTAGGTLAIAGSFNFTGGTVNDGGEAHNVAGDILDADWTVTSTGIWTQTATGTAKGGTFGEFRNLAGVTTTPVRTLRAKKFNWAGDVAATAWNLCVVDPTADGWWTQAAGSTVASAGWVVSCNDKSPGGDITLANKTFRFSSSANQSCEIDGDIDLGTGEFYFYGNGAANTMTIDMASKDLSCGTLTLGPKTATAAGGVIDLGSGTATITTLAVGNAANTLNAIDFGTGAVTITNAVDTTGIPTITSGSGVINFTGGLTIDSDATNDTTWTLDGNTKINGDITIQQTAGTTKLDLADYDLHLRYGDTLTHTAGTLTTTNDYQGRIFADGNTLANITATKWIDVIDGVDGGGNTKLRFIESEYAGNAEASVGCGNMFGLPEVGGPF